MSTPARPPSPARGRAVIIGDLNGADDALVSILRGTRLCDARLRWTGGKSELVQLGDIFNRGGGARVALELLLRLRREARAAGGKVTIVLGNHEVLTVLRNEAYCTEDEYLSFATAQERREWPTRVRRALRRIARDHPRRGPVPPIGPRLDVWKTEHAPGRVAMRCALGPRGRLGRALRAFSNRASRLPISSAPTPAILPAEAPTPPSMALNDRHRHLGLEPNAPKIFFARALPPAVCSFSGPPFDGGPPPGEPPSVGPDKPKEPPSANFRFSQSLGRFPLRGPLPHRVGVPATQPHKSGFSPLGNWCNVPRKQIISWLSHLIRVAGRMSSSLFGMPLKSYTRH